MRGRADKPSGCVRTLAVVMAGAVAMLVLVVAVAVWGLFFRAESRVAPGRAVVVTVPEGSATASIASRLAERGVIANAAMFRVRVRLAGVDGALRPGTYRFTTGMSYDDAIERLRSGPPASFVTVTIPEGFTVEQIGARLHDKLGISTEEFLGLATRGAEQFAGDHPYLEGAYGGSLEGYLFPKTYRMPKGTTAKQAIDTMLDQFDAEMEAVDLNGATQRGMRVQDVVIAASIIEREARLDKERPLVASVIYNRLARDMKLEIDATIEYVLPGNRFRLRNRDLRIDSPYNTYRNRGLTPGPISNPGLASLKAAADPAETEYIYYVLTGKDGSHTFTTNKADFLVAKRKSKEVFGR